MKKRMSSSKKKRRLVGQTLVVLRVRELEPLWVDLQFYVVYKLMPSQKVKYFLSCFSTTCDSVLEMKEQKPEIKIATKKENEGEIRSMCLNCLLPVQRKAPGKKTQWGRLDGERSERFGVCEKKIVSDFGAWDPKNIYG